MREFKEQAGGILLLVVLEIIAGVIIMMKKNLVISYPSLLLLLPALMDLRGDVYGALAFRLVTALYLGAAEPKINSKFNCTNSLAALVVTIFASLAIGFLAFGMSSISGLKGFDSITFMFVSLTTSLTSFVLIVPVSTISIIYAWRRGLDPRNFSSPIITVVADLVTPPLLFLVLSLLYINRYIKIGAIIGSLALAVIILIAVRGELIRRAIRENLPISIIAACASGLGGAFIAVHVKAMISTALLAVVPALNAAIGATAGILANKLSVSIRFGREYGREAARTFINSIIILVLASLIFTPVPIVLSSTSLGLVPYITSIVVLTLISSYTMLSVISYLVSTIAFQRGLDPDNIVFPIITTMGDMLGPLALTFFIRVILY